MWKSIKSISAFVCIGIISGNCNDDLQDQDCAPIGTVQFKITPIHKSNSMIVLKQNEVFGARSGLRDQYLTCVIIPELAYDNDEDNPSSDSLEDIPMDFGYEPYENHPHQVVLYPEDWLRVVPDRIRRAMEYGPMYGDFSEMFMSVQWYYNKDDHSIQNQETGLVLSGNGNTGIISLQDNNTRFADHDNAKWIYNSSTKELFWITPVTSKTHVVYLMTDWKDNHRLFPELTGKIKPFISTFPDLHKEQNECKFIKVERDGYLFSDGNSIQLWSNISTVNYKYYGLWKHHSDTGYLQHCLSGKYVAVVPDNKAWMVYVSRKKPVLNIPRYKDQIFLLKLFHFGNGLNNPSNLIKFVKGHREYRLYHGSTQLTKFRADPELELFAGFSNTTSQRAVAIARDWEMKMKLLRNPNPKMSLRKFFQFGNTSVRYINAKTIQGSIDTNICTN